MPVFRTIVVLACICVLTADAHAAPLSGPIPLPRHRPAIKGEKPGNSEAAPGARRPGRGQPAPLSIAPSAAGAPREVPVAEAPANARFCSRRGRAAPPRPLPPRRRQRLRRWICPR